MLMSKFRLVKNSWYFLHNHRFTPSVRTFHCNLKNNKKLGVRISRLPPRRQTHSSSLCDVTRVSIFSRRSVANRFSQEARESHVLLVEVACCLWVMLFGSKQFHVLCSSMNSTDHCINMHMIRVHFNTKGPNALKTTVGTWVVITVSGECSSWSGSRSCPRTSHGRRPTAKSSIPSLAWQDKNKVVWLVVGV